MVQRPEVGETIPGAGEEVVAAAVVDVQTVVILHPLTTPARLENHPHEHRTRKGGGLAFGPAQGSGDSQPTWRPTAHNIKNQETTGGDGSTTTNKRVADFTQGIMVTGIMITGKEIRGAAGQALHHHHRRVRHFRPRDMKARGLGRRADDKSFFI